MLQWLVLLASITATAPIRVALRVDINHTPTFEAVIYLYNLRLQLDGRIAPGGTLELRRSGGKNELRTPLKQLWRFAVHLARAAEWVRAEFNGRIGTGDACNTALTVGALSTALRMVGARVGAKVNITPEFERPFFAMNARCILFFRGGDIILAGMRAFTGQAPTKKKAGSQDGTASH